MSMVDSLPNLNVREIAIRRAELEVAEGRLAEEFAAIKEQLVPLEKQQTAINRELAELTLMEMHLPTSVSHGGRRNAG